MSLHIERQGDVAIVVPKGPLDGSKLTIELETDMRKLIYDDQKRIILDLGKVSRISSIGIGTLASLHASATNRHVMMHVCEISKRNKDVLAIVWLLRVLNVYETRKEAMAAFEEKATASGSLA